MNNNSPDFISEAEWRGKKVKFELFLTNSFDYLENAQQAYGFVINKEGDLLLVAHADKLWSLPGGHRENGESILDTLVREFYEEAAVVVDRNCCIPFFYQKAYIWENEAWKFIDNQVRYVVFNPVHEEFKSDPDQENPMVFQQYVPINQLREHLHWGDTIDFILTHAPKILAKMPEYIS